MKKRKRKPRNLAQMEGGSALKGGHSRKRSDQPDPRHVGDAPLDALAALEASEYDPADAARHRQFFAALTPDEDRLVACLMHAAIHPDRALLSGEVNGPKEQMGALNRKWAKHLGWAEQKVKDTKRAIEARARKMGLPLFD